MKNNLLTLLTSLLLFSSSMLSFALGAGTDPGFRLLTAEGWCQNEKNRHLGKILESLASITKAAELDKLFPNLPKEYIVQVVYYAKKHAIEPSKKTDASLLALLPDSCEKMSQFYNATECNNDYPELNKLGYGVYGMWGKLVSKSTSAFSKFFELLNGFGKCDNAELNPILCDEAMKLYKGAPKTYMDAIKGIKKEYQEKAMICREGSET